ncbi:Bug family tripartite tricarboxylate transporter substrate binding protein [Pigmentiphaga litoralis]|uniref:Bug family tripartite tricarboxylate transporter substrate binding protein n=1 Tax=Pigmentiphaga litoralis TaxID=516702 RepID=UPI003B42E2DB
MKPCSLPRVLACATGFLMLAAASSVLAEWPERPVRVIIPYAAGAAGDIAFRALSPALSARLGQPVVIDYKAGAGGNIGTAETVRARPDGYTLVLGATNNFVINQYLYKDMTFDPLKDLVPVTRVADVPSVVFVNASVPATSFREFAAYAKAHPGKLNYGSPGAGTAPHLSAFALSNAIGAAMVHVPYKGAQPGVTGLLSNDVQLFLVGYGVAGAHLASGRIRALAVAGSQRLRALPDVPTLSEAGAPEGVLSNWWGLAAPRGTPPEVVRKLADAVRHAKRDPKARETLEAQGFVLTDDTPATFAAQLATEAATWQDIVARSGATVE